MGFFKTVLITSCFSVATPAYSQVRVITGDIEHVYGHGGQVLDDADLRAKNERAESARMERQREREIAQRQEALLAAEQARQAAAQAQAMGRKVSDEFGAVVPRSSSRQPPLRR